MPIMDLELLLLVVNPSSQVRCEEIYTEVCNSSYRDISAYLNVRLLSSTILNF